MSEHSPEGTSRREFLKTSSAAITGAIAAPALLTGCQSASRQAVQKEVFSPAAPAILPGKTPTAVNSDTLRVGLIGCGGRGAGAAAQALVADKNAVLTAMGDAFEDRLESSLRTLTGKPDIAGRVKVAPDHCFVGFDAYQQVIDSGVDVVLLAAPPGFRPRHLKAAVDAGKHIFTEKPMAVDAPGVRSILASAEEAKKKKLSLVAGFCYRYNPGVRAFMQRLHDGEIGDLIALQNTYNAGSVWHKPRQPEWTDMQWQMRNWYYFTWLAGDHIVEQAVHSIDKMAWAMKDVPPKQCVATGGRQVRTGPEFGHIYDHFAVVYEYENGARGFHFCRQQANCAADNSDYILGTKGVGHIVRAFSGPFVVKGRDGQLWRYREETPSDMYQIEHDELFASIRSGNPINDGTWMAYSTLLAIMGRMAAYTGQVITWEDAMNSQENLFPETLDWNHAPPVPPVAMPGQTKFV